ncbi:flavodoxin domain-containing protein [Natronobacterium texcoconense]|uniref:Menaquinone-dependent protoporphyrinogen oxidase n=1 Tax=Natronobacterium texcoconense TaxID=1095778 RepID=A0A1H1IM14_NATTX|nr:flavodoxin domain-containing protein [Natronobacterium texcoconense]SDR38714.1 menaquinone-dependent protoporphyrinogen oxidase [Natronobacterium texcoconense]
MATVLVAYGSSEGQTETVAERIVEVLETEGLDATLVDLKRRSGAFEPATVDSIVVGASIHAGSHQQYVADFVRDHRSTLNRCPSAFFSLSLSAASEDAEAQATADDLLEEFLEETGWNPDGTLAVAGALKYSEYGFFKRFVMRWIGGRASGDTDTSRDYEYTDWDEVESFARQFATLIRTDA